MLTRILGIIGTVLRFSFNIAIIVISVYIVYRFSTYAYDFAKGIASATQPEEKSFREVTVEIPYGASTIEIAKILKATGLIKNEEWFRIQSFIDRMDGQYKSGTYVLNTNMSDEDLMAAIAEGAEGGEMVTIQIPEGYTAADIGKYLEEEGFFSAEEFREVMNQGRFDYDFLNDIPERNTRLEGYLFPDTYFVYADSTPEEIISKMLSRFEEVYNEELENKSLNLPMDEAIIIASIIESEIRVADERALCSSVIQNRLDIDMALQMDSTVIYGLGERKKRLLYADLEVDSPYNTYKYTGLPLGPICNPGRASIKAAIDPAKTDYMYYVVDNLEVGSHEFTVTYDDFLDAKAKYQGLIDAN